jgi:hypothetical protein
MSYVFESLDEYLFEDLGTLKKFNFPKRVIQDLIRGRGWTSREAGRESVVELIENPTDYKKLLKELKPEFSAGVISVDGVAKYAFNRESERKFNLVNLQSIRDDEESDRKRKIEMQMRDEERRRRLESQNENLNERRRMTYHQRGDMGSVSVQELANKMKDLQKDGEVTLELIRPDDLRVEKKSRRSDLRRPEDPLDTDADSYRGVPSKSQRLRYEKYATKKRLEVDKKIDVEREKLRKQIEANFDKAFDKMMGDLRKGYAWYAEPGEFAKKIATGVDFSGIKRLAKAYDAIEPGQGTADDMHKAVQTLKSLGFK